MINKIFYNNNLIIKNKASFLWQNNKNEGRIYLLKEQLQKILSIMVMLLIVMPTFVLADDLNEAMVNIYFENEDGNMVYSNYENAVKSSMESVHILYDAIRYYIGIAAKMGKDVYIETNRGEILDYKLAISDNLFKLRDILGKEKYKVNRKVKYTHELKVVNGVAVIVPIPVSDLISQNYSNEDSWKDYRSGIKRSKEPEIKESVDIVKIAEVGSIIVEIGTSLEEVINLLPKATTILDSKGNIHQVNLKWNVINYNEFKLGDYKAIGTFILPDGIENNRKLELKVETMIRVIEQLVINWPEEVENVYMIKSEVTQNCYINIKIKDEYVKDVVGVYLNGILTNQIEGELSLWRIRVEEGTEVENLKGRIYVVLRNL